MNQSLLTKHFSGYLVLIVALVVCVPTGVAERPSEAELEVLWKDAMTLFAERTLPEVEPEVEQSTVFSASLESDQMSANQALTESWLEALGTEELLVKQQQRFAAEDRSRLRLPTKQPMVILPSTVDFEHVLLNLRDNPSFEGVTVIFLKMPTLRQLGDLRNAYDPLDIRVVESDALRREFSWAKLPVYVDESGTLSTLHF